MHNHHNTPDNHNEKFLKRDAKRMASSYRTWKHYDNWFGGSRRYRTIKQKPIDPVIKAIFSKKALTNLIEYGTILVRQSVTSVDEKKAINYRLIKKGVV